MKNIEELKNQLCFELPDVYAGFLSSIGGGPCKPEVIELENGERVLCDYLYGFDEKRELNINFWLQEYGDEIPDNCVIIGGDPCGAMFLLIQLEDKWEIMYWDHQYSLPGSSDEHNTYEAKINLPNLLKLAGYEPAA